MAQENVYESAKLRAEYLLFHFGTADQILPWAQGPREALGFPERIVKPFTECDVERALDLGCAVGRSSCELSRNSREVIGIDYSQAFIDAAEEMRREGSATIERLTEGHRSQMIDVQLPPGVRPERISFEQGDAMDLRSDLGSFDRVLAANLLCRLAAPVRLLERFPELVRSGGELIITTPCTWLEDFTPPDRWPPGSTLAWLEEHLSPAFELVAQSDEPFLIRETARKFQWTVGLLTKWVRR